MNYGKASERSRSFSLFWGGVEFSVAGLMFSTVEGKRSSFVKSLGKLEEAGRSIICFHGFPGHLGRGDPARSGNPLNKEVSGGISGSTAVLVSFLATPGLTSSDAVSALDDGRVLF